MDSRYAPNLQNLLQMIREKLRGLPEPEQFEFIVGNRLESWLSADEISLPDSSMSFLAHRQERAHEILSRNSRALEEMLARVEQSAILLKGPTAYLHGASPNPRIPSDIDLLIATVEPWMKHFRVSPGSPHEFGQIDFQDAAFDLHRYFPVWKMAAGSKPSVTPIPYEAIEHSSMPHPKLDHLGIAKPELAALITAAHIYGTFTQKPVWRRSKIRLGELLDFYALTSGAQFDADLLDVLATQFEATHCIQFVQTVYESLSTGNKFSSAIEISRGLTASITIDSGTATRSGGLMSTAIRATKEVRTPFPEWFKRKPSGVAIQLDRYSYTEVWVMSEETFCKISWSGFESARKLSFDNQHNVSVSRTPGCIEIFSDSNRSLMYSVSRRPLGRVDVWGDLLEATESAVCVVG